MAGPRRSDARKICPWCRAPLVLEPRYPVMRLFPNAVRNAVADIPSEFLPTIPALVCSTPLCKYRERA